MKINALIVTAVMAITVALVGCSPQSGGGGGAGASIDTASFESTFQAAEATLKASADKAIAAVKGADYSAAIAELKKLAEDVKLTPEQKQAVAGLMEKVQKALTEAAGKATGEATKAMDDVTKALPKK